MDKRTRLVRGGFSSVEGCMKTPCPYCKSETVKEGNRFWPFCSERCKLIDLGKWAVGDYRIPGEPAAEETVPPKKEKDADDK